MPSALVLSFCGFFGQGCEAELERGGVGGEGEVAAFNIRELRVGYDVRVQVEGKIEEIEKLIALCLRAGARHIPDQISSEANFGAALLAEEYGLTFRNQQIAFKIDLIMLLGLCNRNAGGFFRIKNIVSYRVVGAVMQMKRLGFGIVYGVALDGDVA